MDRKLITGALALLCASQVGILATGSPTVAVEGPPCAPVLDAPKPPTTTSPPAAPTGVRIVSGSGGEAESSWDLETELGSGPFAWPESGTADTATHAYFDMLSAMPECMVAYNLRNMDQLLAFMDSTTTKAWDVTYNPAADPDPRRQDAAKVLIPAGKVSLPNNVRLPIPPVALQSLFVTWDSWMGREFAFSQTGIANYKHFQFTSPLRIWTEVKADFNQAVKVPGAVAMVEVRAYGSKENGQLGPNVTNNHPLSPMAGEFAVMPEVWTRYWAYFKLVGEWHEFSLWMADENRNPVLVLNRLQIKPNYADGAIGWEKFWLEYNTSTANPIEPLGPRVAYVRNVVMMKGVTDPLKLLQRPVK
jgi:hypothetical protein